MTNILKVTAGKTFEFCSKPPWYHTVLCNNFKSLVKTVLEMSIYCIVNKNIIVALLIKPDTFKISNYHILNYLGLK